MDKIKALYRRLDTIDAYRRSIGKLEFDMQCCAPPDGMRAAGEDMAELGRQLYALTHSKAYERLLRGLYAERESLPPLQGALVGHLYDDYGKTKNFTPAFAYELDLLSNRAYGDWLAAKKAGDFALYRDTFARLIDYTRKAIDLRDDRRGSYYDECLGDYEKGGSTEQLDAFFERLKARIVPLLRRIAAEGKPIRDDFLSRPCPVERQQALSKRLLKLEGLRESSLVLMTTEHPFTTNFGPTDVRVTTHYYEENFISNIFSTLHEGGHALFMQNEPAEFYENHTADRMSNAMHETISRFYENIIGRSEAFVRLIYPQVLSLSGGVFDDISERELYEAVNLVSPGPIRTDADELSYCLHILIRYELEKGLINGELEVERVPELWNGKYRDYLGVEVENDALGCLQDVHWTGSFGYFPSYALGNAYGAQILARMQKDFDVFAAVGAGELRPIADWLREHVFSIASITTPDEWIKAICGEPLNPDYYLDYLEDKYSGLYGLK